MSVRVIEVTVDTPESGVGKADFDTDPVAAFHRARPAVDKAGDIGRSVAREVVAWARAVGQQAWLGLSHEDVGLAGPASVYDLETGVRLPLGPTQLLHTSTPSEDQALTTAQAAQLGDALRDGLEAPLAETFLADAKSLAFQQFPPDPVRAVLMAAIATELKVKKTLRDLASAQQETLVDYVLTNVREVTVTAVDGLFDSFMLATLGRSLRTDDRELFKSLQKLFRVRNGIAHRGEHPDQDVASKSVRAADSAFVWLNQLYDESPGGSDQAV